MEFKCHVAGREVALVWNQEAAKRYAYRMGELGGEPTGKQLTNPRSVTTALFKVLWALLPPVEFSRYADPEALYVAVDHETEAEAIFKAIDGIYSERFPNAEKKSTSMKSPLQESNSD